MTIHGWLRGGEAGVRASVDGIGGPSAWTGHAAHGRAPVRRDCRMPEQVPDLPVEEFASAKAWERWLARHHATRPGSG